jgi:hypothetical protein
MNRDSSWRRAAALGVLYASLAFAQSDLGSISGFVKDPSSATVPNARVTAKNETGLERPTNTNESGYYTITNVPPGLYTLTVEATGFKRFTSTNNKLNPSSTLTLDAQLDVGSATESVDVSASAQQLQTESASVQNVVARQQIDAL